MAWNSDPRIRDLGAFGKKHKYQGLIVIAIPDGSKGLFAMLTYGKNAELCEAAKDAGDYLYKQIMDDAGPDLTRLVDF